MNFRSTTNESRSNIEYSADAADGKHYGIIKEGSKYYIKVCKDIERKHLAESYDYIHGITSKKENEYKSYNDASKQFELKMMSLNEAYGGNNRTSTLDFKKDEKVFATLTEEARKELNRMHAILENSMTIGFNNTGNPEAPKTAKFNPSIGEPFEEKADAELDKDFKATANNPEKQGTPFEKEEKVSDSDMESDKAPKGGEADNDMKDAEYVPNGAVAAEKPKGGKVVKVNESEEDFENIDEPEMMDDDIVVEGDIVGMEDEPEFSEELSDSDIDGMFADEGEFDPEIEDNFDIEMGSEEEVMPEDDFEAEEPMMDEMPMESKLSLKRVVESATDEVMKSLIKESKERRVNEAFQDMLTRIIKEEITNLNVFGKHPGYRKKPMTTPANKEVVKTNGDKDWNDDSAKSEKPFGSKIGSSAPFDQVVNVLTDAVMKTIKEGLKKK